MTMNVKVVGIEEEVSVLIIEEVIVIAQVPDQEKAGAIKKKKGESGGLQALY